MWGPVSPPGESLKLRMALGTPDRGSINLQGSKFQDFQGSFNGREIVNVQICIRF